MVSMMMNVNLCQIPEGMSSYQADWFVDEDGKFDEGSDVSDAGDMDAQQDDDDNEDDDGTGDGDVAQCSVANVKALASLSSASLGRGSAKMQMQDEHDDDEDDDHDDDASDEADDGMDMDNGDANHHHQHRHHQHVEYTAEDDIQFPDEVETPAEGVMSARDRFARYRALQSFRSSHWHPKENLPQDYARIYQFSNFGVAQRQYVIMMMTMMMAMLMMIIAQLICAIMMSHPLISVCVCVCVCREVSIGKRLMSLQNRLLQEDHRVGSSSARKRSNTSGTITTAAAAAAAAAGDVMDMDNDADDDVEADDDEHHHHNRQLNTNSLMLRGTECVRSGHYIEMVVDGVDAAAAASRWQQLGYLTVFSLLPHEQKLSVLHFNVQLLPSVTEPVKSKETLLFQVDADTAA